MFMDLWIKSIIQVLGTYCHSPELSHCFTKETCLPAKTLQISSFSYLGNKQNFQTQEIKIMYTKESTVIITFFLA